MKIFQQSGCLFPPQWQDNIGKQKVDRHVVCLVLGLRLQTRSQSQFFSLKPLSDIDCQDKRHILLFLSHPFLQFRQNPPQSLATLHKAITLPPPASTSLHQPFSILFNTAWNQREQSRGAFVLCIYVCPSPTGPAVAIKHGEKTISHHHLISAPWN